MKDQAHALNKNQRTNKTNVTSELPMNPWAPSHNLGGRKYSEASYPVVPASSHSKPGENFGYMGHFSGASVMDEGHNRYKTSKDLRTWRGKQKEGAIMKPSTFKKIERKAASAGARNPKAVAGKAYWTTAKAKYRAR